MVTDKEPKRLDYEEVEKLIYRIKELKEKIKHLKFFLKDEGILRHFEEREIAGLNTE